MVSNRPPRRPPVDLSCQQIQLIKFFRRIISAASAIFSSGRGGIKIIPGSYRGAILRAVNLGDDADTTAAVCGQIAGAFYGVAYNLRELCFDHDLLADIAGWLPAESPAK